MFLHDFASIYYRKYIKTAVFTKVIVVGNVGDEPPGWEKSSLDNRRVGVITTENSLFKVRSHMCVLTKNEFGRDIDPFTSGYLPKYFLCSSSIFVPPSLSVFRVDCPKTNYSAMPHLFSNAKMYFPDTGSSVYAGLFAAGYLGYKHIGVYGFQDEPANFSEHLTYLKSVYSNVYGSTITALSTDSEVESYLHLR